MVPKETLDQKVTACLPVAHAAGKFTRDILALQAGMVDTHALTIEEPWKASGSLIWSKTTPDSRRDVLWVFYPRNSLWTKPFVFINE